MSAPRVNPLDAACPSCTAAPGAQCRTRRGRPVQANRPHTARRTAAAQAPLTHERLADLLHDLATLYTDPHEETTR